MLEILVQIVITVITECIIAVITDWLYNHNNKSAIYSHT
ncbi:type I toxin-antitoxin system Fst family toxin [Staphylococcus sp. 11261D007BR]